MGIKDMALYQDMTPVLLYAAVFSSLGAFTFGYGGPHMRPVPWDRLTPQITTGGEALSALPS